MKNLIGKKVVIISDNENYDKFRGMELIITHATNDKNSNGYDSGIYPQMLCCFKDAKTGKDIPFSLYEYEFRVK